MWYSSNKYLISTYYVPGTILGYMYVTKFPKLQKHGIRSEAVISLYHELYTVQRNIVVPWRVKEVLQELIFLAWFWSARRIGS